MAFIIYIQLPTPAAHIAESAMTLSRWFPIGIPYPRKKL
jgi:hypothetical protein